MKKFLLICFLSACTFSAFSQITLTQADLPTIGLKVAQVIDTVPTVLPGSAGAGQAWDFSSLNNSGVDTSVFVDPASTPYASSFPTANLANYSTSNDSTIAYLHSSASALTTLGIAAPTNPFTSDPYIAKLEPSGEDIAQLPATYNQSFSGNFMFKLQFPYVIYGSDSVRLVHHTSYNSLMDGWGTVTTPFGSYSSLRQKLKENNVDSIFVHLPFIGWTPITTVIDSALTYRWFANSIGIPVVQMNMNTDFSTAQSVNYVKSTSLGVAEQSPLKPSLFPNPANNFITLNITNGNISSFEMINGLGEIVRGENVKPGTHEISIGELPAGMYSIILRNKIGNIESVSKIIVVH